MKHTNKRRWRKPFLGTGCLLLAAALLLGPLLREEARAVSSLPHVEDIISSRDTYTILEVVGAAAPANALASYGSLGYYVKGSEPCADWLDALAAMKGREARVSSANAYFSALSNAGVLGAPGSEADDAPLAAVYYVDIVGNDTDSYYEELTLWEYEASANKDLYRSLTLDNAETQVAQGTMTPNAAGLGAYDAHWRYSLQQPGDTNVVYVQNIQRLEALSENPGEGYYFYTPAEGAFVAIDPFADLNALMANTAIKLYPDQPVAVYTRSDGGTYTALGVLGQVVLDSDQTYYYLNYALLGTPSASYTAGCYGVRDSVGFVDVSGFATHRSYGAFIRTLERYEYVGTGGSYDFVAGAGGSDTVNIETRQVYYRGGFTNNEWLATQVFGLAQDDARLRLRVLSCTPGELTAALIASADAIVLSAAFDPTRIGTDENAWLPGAIGSLYTEAMGAAMSDTIAFALAQRMGSVPTVVDGRLTKLDATTTAGKLARFAIGGANLGSAGSFAALSVSGWDTGAWASSHNFVQQNILCITPPFNTGSPEAASIAALVSDSFAATFSEAVINSGFAAALSEIENENFLRTVAGLGASELLPEEMSLASALRYVINFAGTRTMSALSSITVLELEPNTATSALTEDQVFAWLGSPAALADYKSVHDRITIVTMPVAEFVGRIEDLIETYDLIYVGDSSTNFYTNASGETVYNDTAMNGLLYANIGDTYKSHYRLSGLLTRDYSTTERFSNDAYRKLNGGDLTRTFRFSGNDLTSSQADALAEYAEAGHPVVLGNKLVTFNQTSTTTQFSVNVTATTSGNDVELTATVTGVPAGTSITYRWYRSNSSNPVRTQTTTSTTDTRSFPVNSNNSNNIATHYCTVTVGSSTATSRRISVSRASYTAKATADPGSNQDNYVTVTLTAQMTPTLPAGVNITGYQWREGGGSNGTPISGETSQTLRVTSSSYGSDTYRCRLTLSNGETLTTNTVSINYTWEWRGPSFYRYRHYYTSITVNGGGGEFPIVSASYVTGSTGTAGSIVTTTPDLSTRVIDTRRVDYASKLYGALADIVSLPNVLPAAAVTAGGQGYSSSNSATLYRYLNLSKPRIAWTGTSDTNARNGYPTPYAMSGSGAITGLTADSEGKYALRYAFHIENLTDPTPQATTYDCRLYIDSNADGLYREDEQVTDVEITLSNGRAVRPTSGVYRLQAGTEYRVTREMPADYAGLVSWKLEIVKNGTDTSVHASEHNYTHIPAPVGQKKEIRILQIMPNSGGMNLSTNTTYQGLFNQVPDFKVTIQTIRANALDNSGNWSVGSISYTTRAAFLAQFDMLVLGFADVYQEISTDSASDIVSYAENRAVLFTHDTTSVCNVPVDAYQVTNNSGNTASKGSYWGFAFNTILRPVVGLDRYGVTDPTYGHTQMYNASLGQNTAAARGGPVANGYSGATAAQLAAIEAAGYSVAYKPKSVAVSDLDSYTPDLAFETQGFGRFTLPRYTIDGSQKKATSGGSYSASNNDTYSVVQVNEGQITTYPFNLNSAAFGGTHADTLSVSLTHEQYYQLNMNGDDIVVWYTLAGGNFNSTLPKDVVNSYYIYTRGNITYSGAGHSGATVTDDEAKLFVNTMIAAFRSSVQTPSVSIRDAYDGGLDVSLKFFTVEHGDETSLDNALPAAEAAEARSVYFRVSDPNLGSGARTLTVQFFYEDASGTVNPLVSDQPVRAFTPENGRLYWLDSYGAEHFQSATAALTSGTTYRLILPSASSGPLAALGEQDTPSVRVYVLVTTTIEDQTRTSVDYLDLRELGLFAIG